MTDNKQIALIEAIEIVKKYYKKLFFSGCLDSNSIHKYHSVLDGLNQIAKDYNWKLPKKKKNVKFDLSKKVINEMFHVKQQ